MFAAILNSQIGPIIDRLLEMETHLDDLDRRADGFIRIGTCESVDPGAGQCVVTHGDLKTPPIKYFNPSAGEQSETRHPSVGEQCVLLNYGGGDGSAQSVALFGLSTTAYPLTSAAAELTRRLYKDGTESSYDHAAHVLAWKNGPTTLSAGREVAELKVGEARITLKPDSVELMLGSVGLMIDADGVHFSGPLIDHQGKVISTA
jgi:phage baseplate assembly protein V